MRNTRAAIATVVYCSLLPLGLRADPIRPPGPLGQGEAFVAGSSDAPSGHPAAPGEDSTPPPTPPGEPTPGEIEKLWAEASQLYSAGDYQAAYEKMQLYYQLTRDARMLYNLGDLSRELARCSQALSHFEQYLEQAPDGSYRAQAQAAVMELREQCPPQLVPSTQSGAPAAPRALVSPTTQTSVQTVRLSTEQPSEGLRQSSSDNARRYIGYGLIAGGAALGVGAGILIGSAIHKNNLVQSANRAAAEQPPDVRPIWSHDEEQLERERDRERNWAVVLGVGSTLAFASGVATLLWPVREPHPASAPRTSLAIQPSARGLGLCLRVSSL
ncbi:MAG TPA: hypothetical protein VFQ61_34525 [Polyangiaceae bacterium]|nr:hypothetical protein [Polyangiaceae bacterium]